MTSQLEEFYAVTVSNHYRVYIVFSNQKIPVWTPLVKYGIRQYQRSRVKWTHALLMLQELHTNNMHVLEMAFNNGMDHYVIEYDAVTHNAHTNTLCIEQTNEYGITVQETYYAIDVSAVTRTDVMTNWYMSYTETRLTPWTLLQHLLPAKNKITWTCSGLVQVLLGHNRALSFLKPMTPDMLHSYYTDELEQ